MAITNTDAYIVSTDLDGTLLDHHSYDWKAASKALAFLAEKNIPIVFNTSKTLAEAVELQQKIGVSGPVIVENGSALAIHKDDPYCKTLVGDEKTQQIKQHILLEFGTARAKIIDFIRSQKSKHGDILSGYSDWSTDIIAEKTGLSLAEAKLSSEKLYSEPFIWHSDESSLEKFIDNATLAGLKVMKGGRFFHIQGNTSKADPIVWLKKKIEAKNPEQKFTLICLGDNHNDVHMLDVADIPVCVRSPTSSFPPIKHNPRTIQTQKLGPEGWQEAIEHIFSKHNMH